MVKEIEIPFSPNRAQEMLVSIKPEGDKLLTRGYVSGYGGGKTYIGARIAVTEALQGYPNPYLGVEPTYGMIKDVMFPAIAEYLENDLKFKSPADYHYLKNDKDLFIHHKQTGLKGVIQLRSSDNPDSLKGKNVCGAWIDEPFIQDQQAYQQVVARVRVGMNRCITLTGTSEGLGWGSEEIGDKCQLVDTETVDINGETVSIYTFANEDGSIKYIRTSSKLNTALPSDYIDNLLSTHTAEEAKAYIYGEFANISSGRCYYNYDGNIHLRKFELQQAPIDVSVDFNAGEKPMSWNVSQDFGDSTLVRFALQRKNTNTLAMCQYLWEVLRGYFKQGVPPITIYGDYTGNARNSSSDYTDYQIIRQFFVGKVPLVVKVQPNPKIIRRVNLVNARLKNAKGDIHLFLHTDDTKPLQKDFEHCTWDSTGKEDQSNPMLSHSSSALGYMLAQKHPIERTRSIAA